MSAAIAAERPAATRDLKAPSHRGHPTHLPSPLGRPEPSRRALARSSASCRQTARGARPRPLCEPPMPRKNTWARWSAMLSGSASPRHAASASRPAIIACARTRSTVPMRASITASANAVRSGHEWRRVNVRGDPGTRGNAREAHALASHECGDVLPDPCRPCTRPARAAAAVCRPVNGTKCTSTCRRGLAPDIRRTTLAADTRSRSSRTKRATMSMRQAVREPVGPRRDMTDGNTRIPDLLEGRRTPREPSRLAVGIATRRCGQIPRPHPSPRR